MDKNSRSTATESPVLLEDAWLDPIEMGIRGQIRGFIEALVNEELDRALGRARYQRPGGAAGTEMAAETAGYRHGRRSGGCSARSVR